MKRNAMKLAKKMRGMVDRLRPLETSFHDFHGNPKSHVLLTYTPKEIPIAKEEYQLSVLQVQELFNTLIDLLNALQEGGAS